MFTINDVLAKGFTENNLSDGLWDYERFFDDVPKKVQNMYTHDMNQCQYEYDGKEYKPTNRYRGAKPYFIVYEKLVNAIVEKGKLTLCVHYHNDSKVVEYVRYHYGSDWGDKYIKTDCRNITFDEVLEEMKNRLITKNQEEDMRFLKVLDNTIDTHRSIIRNIDEQLKEIEL